MRGEEVLGTTLLDRINSELDGVAEAKPIIDTQQEAVSHVTFLPSKDSAAKSICCTDRTIGGCCIDCICRW